MWCCETRKQDFVFEHGTVVRAKNPYKAYEILSSISLKDDMQTEEVEKGKWIINIGSHVFIPVQALGSVQAQRAAEWSLYLDRRELKIVQAR